MVNGGIQRWPTMCRLGNTKGSSQSAKGNRMIGPPAKLRKEREGKSELIITGHRCTLLYTFPTSRAKRERFLQPRKRYMNRTYEIYREPEDCTRLISLRNITDKIFRWTVNDTHRICRIEARQSKISSNVISVIFDTSTYDTSTFSLTHTWERKKVNSQPVSVNDLSGLLVREKSEVEMFIVYIMYRRRNLVWKYYMYIWCNCIKPAGVNKWTHTNSISVDVQASVSYVNRFVSNGALRVKPGYVCSRVAEILEQPRFCTTIHVRAHLAIRNRVDAYAIYTYTYNIHLHKRIYLHVCVLTYNAVV